MRYPTQDATRLSQFNLEANTAAITLAYRNPIIPGFFPDPSIVRVDNNYFTVHSTFQFFPSIVISHSHDLVHWTQIGHVFDDRNPLDLAGFDDGCGIWAPDISYHEGWFYIFFCLVQLKRDRSVNVRGNYCVRARSILGPYGPPVQLTSEGNDPSHFVDVDGKHYMAYAAGTPLGRGTKIVQLSEDCSSTVGVPHWMNWGIERRAPEGPHVFRKGAYYYHTMAAGSGRYDGHHQLIARSRHLLGPYEESPYGPFIAQEDSTSSLQHHGHAKLVQTANGDWWALYLLQRRIGGVSPLGRETGMDPVHWSDDGWPLLNGGSGPSAGGTIRHETAIPSASIRSAAASPWMSIRGPIDPAMIRFDSNTSAIRIRCGSGSLASLNPGSVLLQRETSHHYGASVRVEFDALASEEAGLTCYYDTASHLSIGICGEGRTKRVCLRACRGGIESLIASRSIAENAHVWLRVRVCGLARSFSFAVVNGAWQELGSIETPFLSDEGTPHWGFTGTLIGLFAMDHGSGQTPTATFRDFSIHHDENAR